MRTERFRLLALLVPAAITVVACSGVEDPAPKKTNTKKASNDDNEEAQESNLTRKETPAATAAAPAAAPPPPAAVPDAGVDAAKPPPTQVKPPDPPATRFCQNLSRCCGSLDFYQSLACTATVFAGDETTCGVELAVCQAGGIDFDGIGDFFGGFGGGGDQDP
jgi:hypothetical protein